MGTTLKSLRKGDESRKRNRANMSRFTRSGHPRSQRRTVAKGLQRQKRFLEGWRL